MERFQDLIDFMRGVFHMDHMFHMSRVLSLISLTSLCSILSNKGCQSDLVREVALIRNAKVCEWDGTNFTMENRGRSGGGGISTKVVDMGFVKVNPQLAKDLLGI